MKILLPFQDPYNRPLTHDIVSGGTEMFCKLVYENFDTEVLHLIYKDTLEKQGLDNHKQRQRYQLDIIEKAEQCNADVIVNNFAWASFCGPKVAKSHIPIMNIEHCFYPFTSILNRWNNLVDNGHSIFFVSEFQQKSYSKMAKRADQRIVPYNLVRPAFCKVKPQLMDIEYECGTIGRCDKEKNPFKLKHMTKHTDLKTLVITSHSSHEKNSKYYEKNKNWSDAIWNEPHDIVIKNISKCRTFFSTWNKETWGITALEALSCGLPIILNCDNNGDHASEIIPASLNHFKKIPNNDKEALVDAIKSFDVDRKEIQEMTWEKHNLESWKIHISNCIDKTIENFKKSNSTLEEFL